MKALRLLGGRSLVLADQALVSGSNFVLGIVLARALGLEGYGAFALSWMVVLFLSSLHQAFMVAPLFAALPAQQDRNAYAASLLRLQLLFSALSVPTLAIGLSIAQATGALDQPIHLLLALPVAAVAFVHQDLLRRLLFALERPGTALLLDLVAYGAQVPLLLALGRFGHLDASTCLLVIAVALGAPALVLHATLARTLPSPLALRTTIALHWSHGRHLLLTAVLQWSSGNLFIVAAGGLLGAAVVGALRMAQNLVGLLHVLFLALENRVPLNAARIRQSEGEAAMMCYMKRSMLQASVPTLVVLVALVLFRNPLLDLVYGTIGNDAPDLLIAFAALYALIFLGTFLRFAIRTLERNRVILLSYVITTAFSVLAAEPLVGTFGPAGVMCGLFTVHLINLGLYITSIRNELAWAFK